MYCLTFAFGVAWAGPPACCAFKEGAVPTSVAAARVRTFVRIRFVMSKSPKKELPNQLHGQLHNAARLSSQDAPEGSGRGIGVRIIEANLIKGIEEFAANLRLEPLSS